MTIRSQEPFRIAGYEILIGWMIMSSSLTLVISLEIKIMHLGIAQSPGRIKEERIFIVSHMRMVVGNSGEDKGLSSANQRT